MRFELFVALRYLLAPRRQAFISVISSISTLGVAVGVVALIVALALMTGLQSELRDRILGSTAHVYVWRTTTIDDYRAEVARLRGVPGVLGAAPAIRGKALVSTDSGDAFITLKGIDADLESGVTDIGRRMLQGSVAAIAGESEDGLPGILIGRRLAQELNVRVGDPVRMLTLQGTLTPGGMVPRVRRVRVAGIYELGLLEFDASWGFISLEFAGRLAGRETPELIQLRIEDIWTAPAIARSIPKRFGDAYVAQDWQDLNQSLFSALWIEKMAISITVGLIVIVAALQIVASLVLLVMEKSRDIAILKTMGASPRRISTIFMVQGVIIGIVGTTVGGVIGAALCWVLDRYRLIRIDMDVYQIAYIPFVIEPIDFLVVVVGSVIICFVATLYPSRQASRLDPVQALRFE
jgi:lipoprotein-releasing system permease protein